MSAETAALEDLPHVLTRISLLWGYPELYLYLEQLLIHTRPDNRQGLSDPVVRELLWLFDVHYCVCSDPRRRRRLRA